MMRYQDYRNKQYQKRSLLEKKQGMVVGIIYLEQPPQPQLLV
jgi:hypothetical protein